MPRNNNRPPLRGPYGRIVKIERVGHGIFYILGSDTAGYWLAAEIRKLSPLPEHRKTAWYSEGLMKDVCTIVHQERMHKRAGRIEVEKAIHNVCINHREWASVLKLGEPLKRVATSPHLIVESSTTGRRYRLSEWDRTYIEDTKVPIIPHKCNEEAFLAKLGYIPVVLPG